MPKTTELRVFDSDRTFEIFPNGHSRFLTKAALQKLNQARVEELQLWEHHPLADAAAGAAGGGSNAGVVHSSSPWSEGGEDVGEEEQGYGMFSRHNGNDDGDDANDSNTFFDDVEQIWKTPPSYSFQPSSFSSRAAAGAAADDVGKTIHKQPDPFALYGDPKVAASKSKHGDETRRYSQRAPLCINNMQWMHNIKQINREGEEAESNGGKNGGMEFEDEDIATAAAAGGKTAKEIEEDEDIWDHIDTHFFDPRSTFIPEERDAYGFSSMSSSYSSTQKSPSSIVTVRLVALANCELPDIVQDQVFGAAFVLCKVGVRDKRKAGSKQPLVPYHNNKPRNRERRSRDWYGSSNKTSTSVSIHEIREELNISMRLLNITYGTMQHVNMLVGDHNASRHGTSRIGNNAATKSAYATCEIISIANAFPA